MAGGIADRRGGRRPARNEPADRLAAAPPLHHPWVPTGSSTATVGAARHAVCPNRSEPASSSSPGPGTGASTTATWQSCWPRRRPSSSVARRSSGCSGGRASGRRGSADGRSQQFTKNGRPMRGSPQGTAAHRAPGTRRSRDRARLQGWRATAADAPHRGTPTRRPVAQQ